MDNLKKVYDLEAIGGAKVLNEIDKVAEAFERVKKIKVELNSMADKTTDPTAIRKITTEIDKQTTAHKNNIVKLNSAVTAGLKLASVNKDLRLEILNVVESTNDVKDALNDKNKAELAAIQSAGSYSKASKLATDQQVKRTKSTRDLNKEMAEEKIISANNLSALKNRIREDLNAKGSLENRRAALIRLRDEYDKLSPLERDTSWGKRLEKTIANVNTHVVALEGQTGRSGRVVGTYTKGIVGAFQTMFGGIRQMAYILPGLGIAGIFDLILQGLLSGAEAMGIFNRETKEAISYLDQLKDSFAEIDEQLEFHDKYLSRQAKLQIAQAKARGATAQEITKIEQDGIRETIKLQDIEIQKQIEQVASLRRIYNLKEAGSTAIKESEEEIQKAIDEGDRKISELQEKRKDNQSQLILNSLGLQEKLQKEGNKKREALEKIELAREKRESEERSRIIFEAKLALLDAQSAEELKLKHSYEADLKKLEGASNADKKIVEEAYQVELKAIRDKYAKRYYDDIFDRELKELEIVAKQAEKLKDIEQDKQKHLIDILKKFDDQQQKSADKRFREAEKKEKEHEEEKERIRKRGIDNAFDLAQQFANNQAALRGQEINNDFEKKNEALKLDKELRLSQAQSAAERIAIEEEFARKATELERQRNIAHQESARKQLKIDFALASLKAVVAGFQGGGIAEAFGLGAYALGQYLVALQALNSQKFEFGGEVPSSTGGPIVGPSHAAGGVPFNYEAEGGEMAIINKNSTMDSGVYNLTGTPRQIASAINELGGGVQFAPGALTRKFEYGGLLGTNLSAPVFRGYYANSTDPGERPDGGDTLNAILALTHKISNLQVVLNPHDVTKAQRNFSKQTKIGTI